MARGLFFLSIAPVAQHGESTGGGVVDGGRDGTLRVSRYVRSR